MTPVAVGMRDLLKKDFSQNVFGAYVHLMRDDQDTYFEHCNMSQGDRTMTTILLKMDGTAIPEIEPKKFVLKPGELMKLDVREWINNRIKSPLQCQCAFILEAT